MKEILEIWLADDDDDDCLLFQEALGTSDWKARLLILKNGDHLMAALNNAVPLPDILFLDLNMPRKNGFVCLNEIKSSDKLKALPVIILSTSLRQHVVDQLYNNEAAYYIRKPGDQKILQLLIHRAIDHTVNSVHNPVSKDEFVLS